MRVPENHLSPVPGFVGRSLVWIARPSLLAVAALLVPLFHATAATVSARTGELTLPTYGWAAVKHPYFRGTDAVNIYPYQMLDFLSRDQTNRTYRTVVLENEFLRVTFLPELGGRIHEVLDKTLGQPMFYVNHAIKPGLIGQCGAWISGGVEWNTGPQGHTVSCMLPVAVVILPPEKDGARSVAIGETERIYGTKWTVVVTLRPGRSFLEERIRIYNPTETIRPYYFWNCTAQPNTPGFRFIYPMTLGMDHSGEKFFQWPIHDGRDLTRGTNYQDASSIFAYNCDQDFFGSYNDDLDHGVVSSANHHQLPGKKAWTWGHGGYGTMHQMDLTDNDGPYNEVQTGPLLTQGEVGRLDPGEAVEWNEWWYPVHGLGGFTFANPDVAVNAAVENGALRLRLLGTANWSAVQVRVLKEAKEIARTGASLSANEPAGLRLDLGGAREPLEVELAAGQRVLAHFRVPLDLPVRQPPPKKPAPATASEFARAGWEEFLFARFPEAERQFNQALEKDPHSVAAHTGLAFLQLESDLAEATRAARAALATNPDNGLARFARAVAASRISDNVAALDDAWQAALDPATAVPARALAAKLLIRRGDFSQAIAALSADGPWRADAVCRNRLAYALLQRRGPGDVFQATALTRANLQLDPLDSLALNLDARARGTSNKPDGRWAAGAVGIQTTLDLLAGYSELGAPFAGVRGDAAQPETSENPLALYWFAYCAASGPAPRTNGLPGATAQAFLDRARRLPPDGVFPQRRELVPALRWALATDPSDGKAALYLGHLLFHLGRHAEGRALWQRAAELGAEPAVAYRALGMAAKTLDGDLKSAREWLEKANQADPKDSIVARDLANVLFALADKADSDTEKRALATEARDQLQAAFAEGKGRSDFVALLARAQSRLHDFAATARMLDSVRVTIWEGAHEVHDLFAQAHLALGEADLKAGRATEALAEFNRALEYPKNLATGRLENTREAHIHYLRGRALAALGQAQAAREAWRKAAAEPASENPQIEEARRQAQAALEKAGPP